MSMKEIKLNYKTLAELTKKPEGQVRKDIYRLGGFNLKTVIIYLVKEVFLESILSVIVIPKFCLSCKLRKERARQSRSRAQKKLPQFNFEKKDV